MVLTPRKSALVKSRSGDQFGLIQQGWDDDSKAPRKRWKSGMGGTLALRRLVLLARSRIVVVKGICLGIVISGNLWLTFSMLSGHRHLRTTVPKFRPRVMKYSHVINDEEVSREKTFDTSSRPDKEGTNSHDSKDRRKLSKKYEKRIREPIDEGNCVAQAEWQKTHYPSCLSEWRFLVFH